MSSEHRGSNWGELERLVDEYLDRDLVDDETRDRVEALMEGCRHREALEAAIRNHRRNRVE